MSLNVDVASDGVRAPLARARIAEIARTALRAEHVRNALVSVTLLDRRAIARMNRLHLDHSGATDVISFGFTRASDRDPIVGDIYIAPEVARDNARARHVSVREELARLVVHGVLHILGYDHPEDDGRERAPMWRRQEQILGRALRSVRR